MRTELIRPAILAAMQARGISQAELARMSGIHYQHVSRYLRGRAELRTDTVERMLSALGLSLDHSSPSR